MNQSHVFFILPRSICNGLMLLFVALTISSCGVQPVSKQNYNGVGFINLGDSRYLIDRTGKVDVTDRINNILRLLPGNPGQVTVFVPAGIYRVKDLHIPGNVSFIGEGDQTRFLASGDCEYGVIYFRNPRATVRSIYIDGNQGKYACSGMYIHKAWGTVIDAVRFDHLAQHAIYGYDVNHVEIKNSMIVGGRQGMIRCDGCDNSSIHHNIFQEESPPYVINFEVTDPSKNFAHSASVYDNWFELTAADLNHSIIVGAPNVSIFNNYLKHGLMRKSDSHILVLDDAYNTRIEGNNFHNGKGIAVNIKKGAKGTHISKNAGLQHPIHFSDSGQATWIEYHDEHTGGHHTIRSSQIHFGSTQSKVPPSMAIDTELLQYRTRPNEYFGPGENTYGKTTVQGLHDLLLRSGVFAHPNGQEITGNVIISDEKGHSDFRSGHLKMGNYHLWIDENGGLRIKKGGRPSTDFDGVLVGEQTSK